MIKIKAFLKKIFVSKYSCVACKREIVEGEYLCNECAKEMPFVGEKRCRICGRFANNYAQICEACIGAPKQFDKGRVLFIYQGLISSMIFRLKVKHALNLLDYLIPLMEDLVKQFDEKIDYVTYVPMRKNAIRMRGYNQSEEMAKLLAERNNISLFDGIEKVRNTRTQKTLNYAKRKMNLKRAFRVTGSLEGKTVLVVDDVSTTGATLNEIAKELKRSGSKRVLTLCIAATNLYNVM